MERIPLQSIPNQSLTIRLGVNLYQLTFKAANNIMAVDVTRNSGIVELGARVVAGTPILPYQYQEDGNFFLITENGEYPYYTQFGVTQFLSYLSPDELSAYRG